MPDNMRDIQAAVEEMAAEIGIPVSFKTDAALQGLKRGAQLTMGEIRAMPDGTPVWGYYREYGEQEPRVDGPYFLKEAPYDDDSWLLDDGSSFGCAFDPEIGLPDDALCSSDCAGEGMMLIYRAEKE